MLDYPKAPARRSTFTLTKFLQSYISRFPRREMSFARAGKTAANEAKYPFIVEVPVAANGLNVELNSQIVSFHKLHHTTLRVHSETGKFIISDPQVERKGTAGDDGAVYSEAVNH